MGITVTWQWAWHYLIYYSHNSHVSSASNPVFHLSLYKVQGVSSICMAHRMSHYVHSSLLRSPNSESVFVILDIDISVLFNWNFLSLSLWKAKPTIRPILLSDFLHALFLKTHEAYRAITGAHKVKHHIYQHPLPVLEFLPANSSKRIRWWPGECPAATMQTEFRGERSNCPKFCTDYCNSAFMPSGFRGGRKSRLILSYYLAMNDSDSLWTENRENGISVHIQLLLTMVWSASFRRA